MHVTHILHIVMILRKAVTWLTKQREWFAQDWKKITTKKCCLSKKDLKGGDQHSYLHKIVVLSYRMDASRATWDHVTQSVTHMDAARENIFTWVQR